MRIKFGIDPTGSTIHLGRTVPLWRLKKYQDEGHQIVLIIGDFTAEIGDPSDKTDKRPKLTDVEIRRNGNDYLDLIGKILDIDKCEYYYNSTWLREMPASELLQLMDRFTIQQTTARRNFSKRLEEGTPISLMEIMYPILQGYDSYQVRADIEIGGEDQLFNMLAGRDVQRHYGQKPQEVVTTPMLMGSDGRKMSTTLGNVINITDDKKTMFDKILSIRDELALDYFKNCCPESERMKEIIAELSKEKPAWRDTKEIIANEIVALYHK